jgi:hypothetical protein
MIRLVALGADPYAAHKSGLWGGGIVRGSRLAAWCLVSAGALVWLPAAGGAEISDVLQRAHAWGRFGMGSWRHVRIVTENFDAQGNVTSSSVTDNRTTLVDVAPDGVTLKVEVTIEVGGQKFPSPPQIVHQGYAGEAVGQTVSVKSVDGETLTVDGREIACEAQEIEILGGGNKEIVHISYSPGTTPAVLKRTSTTSDAASGKTTQEAVAEVFALDKRLKVLSEPLQRRGFRMRHVLKTDRGTTTTWSDNVPEVPGEMVAQSSQKFDDQGRLLRRTTLSLVGYGAHDSDDGDDYRDLSRRKRRHRRGR